MRDKLQQIKNNFEEELKKIKDKNSLEELEVKYLGRKGELTLVLKELKNLAFDQKAEMGQLANRIKKEIKEEIKKAQNNFQEEPRQFIDVTLPGDKIERGHLNPLTIVQSELEDIFSSLGFMVL